VLTIASLHKSFDVHGVSVPALCGVDLEVARGEFFVLLGSSGCGKTTMLRSVAGLEQPSVGTIAIDGSLVFSARERITVPPERRPMGMVFQSYAVWPHMDVYQNVAFPLRHGVRRLRPGSIDERVRAVLELLELKDLAERPVTTLSGGQQQRVALARALALQPKVLLMDEPLSNLDLKLQLHLRGQIKDLMHHLGLTTLYVTHNQSEALEMGDRIAVMDGGRILQIGRPIDLYRSPEHEFVARFIGEMNLLEGVLVARERDYAVIDTAIGTLRAAGHSPTTLARGARCFVGIRPEDVELRLGPHDPNENEYAGFITAMRFAGDGLVYTCRVGANQLKIKWHGRTELPAETPVRMAFPPEFCILVQPENDSPARDPLGNVGPAVALRRAAGK
jgi:ABC-type Fe3+/spermidine/putrescine transport system ATPase subunit